MSSCGCASEDKATEAQLSNCIKWRIRPMQLEDIEECLVIWRQVELTEAHQTVASSLVTDPNGFFVAELDNGDKGRPRVIGMCAGTLARPDTAFMGFYAVEPQFQGLGVGRELWAKTSERLNEFNVGLYGVPMMSDKYKKTGFKLEDSIRMLIFESEPGQVMQLEGLKSLKDLGDNITLELVESQCETLIDKVINYDAAVNKCKRELLLRNYLSPGEAHGAGAPLTLALVNNRQPTGGGDSTDENLINERVREALTISQPASDADRQLLGYACIRADNTNGAMIGPIYADSPDLCEVLLRSVLEQFPLPAEGKYSAMSLTSNPNASEILQRVGLREMDQCSRMFTKFVPDAQANKIFYVHSPNFTLF